MTRGVRGCWRCSAGAVLVLVMLLLVLDGCGSAGGDVSQSRRPRRTMVPGARGASGEACPQPTPVDAVKGNKAKQGGDPLWAEPWLWAYVVVSPPHNASKARR